MSTNLGLAMQAELKPHEQEMLDLINMVEEEQRNMEMGISLGPRFKQFTEVINGLRPSLIFIPAQSNVGKTALAAMMCMELVKNNEDVYCLYFAIDDRIHEILPRFIACDQRIPIEAVQFPKKYKDDPNILRRREIGYDVMRRLVGRIKVRDINFGDTIEYIEETIREHQAVLPPDTKVVVFIDNFYDVACRDVSFNNQNDKLQHLGKEADRIANQYAVPIIATAELRKLNGTRRPMMEDLRETVKLVYKAKAICMCYNEVGLKKEQANIYWERQGNPMKQPVLEVHFVKNKLSSFKSTLFYNFYPDQSYLEEVGPEGRRRYISMID